MSNIKSINVGVEGLLLILFIGLKLTNVINWSWLWVLSPLWIPVALMLVVGVISLMIFAVFLLFRIN